MISVSIGFGIFPMHLYDVVRSGVDPLVVKITEVVPVAQSRDGADSWSVVGLSETVTTTPFVAIKVLPTPMQTSPGGSE
jgi:NADH-quinone oxidoreductase subunit M